MTKNAPRGADIARMNGNLKCQRVTVAKSRIRTSSRNRGHDQTRKSWNVPFSQPHQLSVTPTRSTHRITDANAKSPAESHWPVPRRAFAIATRMTKYKRIHAVP